MRWSPYSRESCALTLPDDRVVGFGANPIFDSVPGAWNIFWLTFAQLDGMSHYKGDLKDYLVSCDALAVCVGAALQVGIGEMAEKHTPLEFIEAVKTIPTFLPFVFFGERWFSVAKARAIRYRQLPDNVIRIDFRKGG